MAKFRNIAGGALLAGMLMMSFPSAQDTSSLGTCITLRPLIPPDTRALVEVSEQLRLIDEERFQVIQSLESAQLAIGDWEFTAETLLELSLLETMDLDRALEVFQRRSEKVTHIFAWFRSPQEDYHSLHRRLARVERTHGLFNSALENICSLVLAKAGVDEASSVCGAADPRSIEIVAGHFRQIRKQFLHELTQVSVYLNFGRSILQTHLEEKTVAQRSYQALFQTTPTQQCASVIR